MDAAARTPDEEVLNTNVMGIEGPSHLRLLGAGPISSVSQQTMHEGSSNARR